MFSRRDFLNTSLWAGAGLALGVHRAALAADGKGALPAGESLRTRAIPASGEQIPVVGAGTSGSFVAEIGSEKYQRLKEVMAIFFNSGATVFDTSPNYGGADKVLGALLEEGGWRDQCFLATKIAADSRAEAERQWAESLKALRTDKVELLQVHNLRDWKTQLPYARELKEQGKTKYVGVPTTWIVAWTKWSGSCAANRWILSRSTTPSTRRRRRKPSCRWPVTKVWRC